MPEGSSDRCPSAPRIALFGPQVTYWTHEELSELQSVLLETASLDFLSKTLEQLPSVWSRFERRFSDSGFQGGARLRALAEFATGKSIPDPKLLNNTILAPLTVVSQVVDFVQNSLGQDQNSSLLDSQAAQGFCIGFLSAAALAAAHDWSDFQRNISNALRLAALIGLVIDAEDASHDVQDRGTAISVHWKTAADRAHVETLLDVFANAYISCITDDQTLTITLPYCERDDFCSRISETQAIVNIIGLDGYYHHCRHVEAAETLKQLCIVDKDLALPNGDKLRLPLRSTADANIISTGALQEIAIDLILCKRAHWYLTVKQTAAAISDRKIDFVPIGRGFCVPRSLSPKKFGDTDGIQRCNDVSGVAAKVDEIAVVGMACRFPEADSIEEFWNLLSSGGTAINKLPIERFNPADIRREPKLADFWGNFLRTPDVFDHRFFSISGREAKSMDPQQRLALQVAYEALESAGYAGSLTAEKKTDIGCYLGVGSVDYEDNVASENANAFSATGTLRAFITGRISHFFGWTGPSVTIDTACSSSGVAIHTACKALLEGECSMALAGGANVITSPHLYQNLSAASFLNPDGASRAFDVEAGGYCRGEGAGIVVLKPLSKAIADGDHILGVIAGSAVNQGSNCSPITVPDSQSQGSLYQQALSIGRLKPSDVTYVEAHGTGTSVGDPIEYESVQLALSGPERRENLFLGSVKDNIGHAEAASGAAGVIKTLLMMQQKTIPKQANFTSLNPRIRTWPLDKIKVPKDTQSWTPDRLVALVNNYGAAGSNVSIAIRAHEDAPLSSKGAFSGSQNPHPCVTYPVFLSAKSADSLRTYMDTLKSYALKAETSFGSLAYNISRRQNASFEYKAAFVATDSKDFISTIESTSTRIEGNITRTEKRPVVLCFGGQTGRSVTLSKDLFESSDLLQNHLNECNAVCLKLGLPSIFPAVFEDNSAEDIVTAHCVLLSVQISCAKCWIDCGLAVDTLIGHSFGQLTALCVADSIPIEDAFRLVSSRANLIRDSWGPEHGGMLSVECDRKELEAVLSAAKLRHGSRVDVACYNGPRSFVLAGDMPSIGEVEEKCQHLRTARLRSTHGYHSYLANGILSELEQVAKSIKIQAPRTHVETCSPHANWANFTAKAVAQHSRQPVYFEDAVRRIADRSPSAIWLEAGSATPVISMARRILHGSDKQNIFVPTNIGSKDAISKLADASCRLWEAGSSAKSWLLHRASSRRFQYVNIPPYQFEKIRHWIQYRPNSELGSVTSIPSPSVTRSELITPVKSDGHADEHLFMVQTRNALFDLAVRGHAVAGQSLCPASLYVELASRSATAVANSAPGTVNVPHIKDMIMSSPLGLSTEALVFLRLHRKSEETWNFIVFSQSTVDRETEDARTEHARGCVSLVPAQGGVPEVRLNYLKKFTRNSRIDKITNSSSSAKIGGPVVYQLFSDVVEYANYYRGVKKLSAMESEAVGFVTVPTTRYFSTDAAICDPISLDNFLQVAGIHTNCLSSRGSNEVFMCTTMEEVIFSAAFTANDLGARSWTVYSRYDKISKTVMMNDIFVFDESSKDLVLVINGATFRSVPLKSLRRSLVKINNTVMNTSDNDSDELQDSGYQTRLSTPQHNNDCEKLDAADFGFLNQGETFTASKKPQAQEPLNRQNSPEELIQSVRDMFSHILELPAEEIKPTSKMDDLGIDSLLVTEVLSEVKKRFQVIISQDQFQTCTDVVSLCHLIEPNHPIESDGQPATRFREAHDDGEKLVNGGQNDEHHTQSNSIEQDTRTDRVLAMKCRECFIEVKPAYDVHAESTGFANFCRDVFPLQSELVVQYVVEGFASLGCDLQKMQLGGEVSAIRHDPRHKKLIPQIYKILEEAKLIKKADDGTFHRTAVLVPQVSASALFAVALDKFPKHSSEIRLLHATGQRLADCISGKVDPLALVFRDSAARALLEDVYTNAPMFRTGTLLLSQYLSTVLKRFGGSRKLKILELGAGTGGTTKCIVQELAKLRPGYKFSYTFTDLSSSFVATARRKFANWSFMDYVVLNIEEDPDTRFLGAYDLILSTNCIHATENLVQSTRNIRKMLRPDGVLCLVELTSNLFWFDLVFGLLKGWWRFNDGRNHALADEYRWERCLNTAGFDWVDWSNTSSKESDILRVITASPYKMALSTRAGVVDGDADFPAVRSGGIHEQLQTVVYKTADGMNIHADIHYPPEPLDPDNSLPVALMIHGGGHVMLSRNDVRPEQTQLLLRSGFLPVSIDYRLCPEKTIIEGPMADVADALAWIRNALPRLSLTRADVRVNAEKVVCIGWSTGGTLAMSTVWTSILKGVRPPEAVLGFYCPTDYEDPFWTKSNIPTGSGTTDGTYDASSYNLDQDIWVGVCDKPITNYNILASDRALGGWMASNDPRSRLALYMNWHGRTLHVLLNGLNKQSRSEPQTPTPDQIKAISPLAYIRSNQYVTPTFLIHPRQDDLIPWQQAQRTIDALRSGGNIADLRIVEDAPHLFDVYRGWRDNEDAWRAVMEGYEFLCKHVGLALRT